MEGRCLGLTWERTSRELIEKDEVASRDVKWSWWLPENAGGFLI